MHIQWQSRRFYPDLYGGLEVIGYEVVKAWRAMGHQVSVMTENYPDGPFVHDEPLPGVSCTRIPTAGRGLLWRVAPCARVARWAWHQRRASYQAQAVVATNPECVVASKLALPRRPVVYRCETVSEFAAAAGAREKVSRPSRWVDRMAAKMADVIAVPSETIRRQLVQSVQVPEAKIHMVPYGVEFSRFAEAKPCKKVAELKNKWHFVAACISRLDRQKGIHFALQALAKMKYRQDTCLLIVGEGPEESSLRSHVGKTGLTENVVFTGKVADPEVYLAGADVLVSPSLYESFCIVLLEAMAAGVPCVSWRSEFPRAPLASSEIIVEGETGLCADPFNTDDLARCLDTLAENPDLRRQMGQAGQTRCRNTYSWARTAKSYLDLANGNHHC